ncbi:MAG: hypothetical protein AABW88_04475 [Nanoarchaeota archaeon]
MNIKPYLLALSIALEGCALTKPGHYPAVNKDSIDYQNFRLARIACVYDGTVKVHKKDLYYSFEGDKSCSPRKETLERVMREVNSNNDDRTTLKEIQELEEKVFLKYVE